MRLEFLRARLGVVTDVNALHEEDDVLRDIYRFCLFPEFSAKRIPA